MLRAGRIDECAFGIHVKQFNVLENNTLVFPEKAVIITKACCVLHNIIKGIIWNSRWISIWNILNNNANYIKTNK